MDREFHSFKNLVSYEWYYNSLEPLSYFRQWQFKTIFRRSTWIHSAFTVTPKKSKITHNIRYYLLLGWFWYPFVFFFFSLPKLRIVYLSLRRRFFVDYTSNPRSVVKRPKLKNCCPILCGFCAVFFISLPPRQ